MSGEPTRISQGLLRLTFAIAALEAAIGPLLFGLPDRTDTLFAWTINPPLTAAFLGGGYLTAFVIQVFVVRYRVWSRVRIAFPAMLAFTTLTTVATLLHLDKFHFASPNPGALATAWAWTAVYLIVTALLWVAVVVYLRKPHVNEPVVAPASAWVRIGLAIEGGVLVVVGLLLFVAPTQAAPVLWPWMLTPLTAQTVAAWLIGFGLAAAVGAREVSWERLRIALAGNIAFGALELLAIARSPDGLRWTDPIAWASVACLLGILGLGIVGWIAGRAALLRAQTANPMTTLGIGGIAPPR